MKTAGYLLILFLFLGSFLHGQSDSVLIPLHPSIGDTLDSYENDRYKVVSEKFYLLDYALFYMKEGQVKAELNYFDNTTEVIDYSIEKLMREGDRIDAIMARKENSYVRYEKRKGKKKQKAKLRVAYGSRTKRIRKHNKIRIILHEKEEVALAKHDVETAFRKDPESELLLARFVAFNDFDEFPSILVKLQRGPKNYVVIPLDNIKMIRFYTPAENVFNKVIGTASLTAFVFAGLASIYDNEAIPAATITAIIGYRSFRKGNRQYEIGENSKFEIRY